MKDANKLFFDLSRAFDSLWQEYVRRSGGGAVEYRHKLAFPFFYPPIDDPSIIGGVPYNDLIANLYGGEGDEASILAGWDYVCEAMRNGTTNLQKLAVSVFKEALPGSAYSGNVPVFKTFAEYLKQVSFKDGFSLRRGPDVCLLATPSGKVVGIDRLALISSDRATRMRPRKANIDFSAELRGWRKGRTKVSATNIGLHPTYTNLLRFLPDLGHEIDLLFAVAIEAGPDHEKALIGKADYRVSPDASAVANKLRGVLVDLDVLIRTAKGPDPYFKIQQLLKGFMSHKDVAVFFGTQGERPTIYDEVWRARDLLSLQRIMTTEFLTKDEEKEQEKSDVGKFLSQMFGV